VMICISWAVPWNAQVKPQAIRPVIVTTKFNLLITQPSHRMKKKNVGTALFLRHKAG
jgi:DNA-directed RNA polymerase